jgi:hypothetical protein
MQIAVTLIWDMMTATRVEWPWEIGLNGFHFDKNSNAENLFAHPRYEWRFLLRGPLKCGYQDDAVGMASDNQRSLLFPPWQPQVIGIKSDLQP